MLSLAMLAFDELRAVVELMFLAAYTDGKVTPEERAAFRGQVIKGTHGKLDPKVVDEVLAIIEVDVAGADPEALLADIRDRLADARKRHAALVLAARVILADGVLGLDEVAFLRRATAVMGEPSDLAESLLREAREPV
jgi:uncharacterized tellurite resistance protein B-like protein